MGLVFGLAILSVLPSFFVLSMRACIPSFELRTRVFYSSLAFPRAGFHSKRSQSTESKRGEYYVKLADEKMNYVSDEKTWMVTDMW